MGVIQRAARRPFRLTPPPIPEEDLHCAVVQALDRLLLPPTQWTTFPAGQIKLPPMLAAKLARMGLKRGWPDVLILHGKLYGIELKRRGGKLSKTYFTRDKRTGALRERLGQADVFPKLEEAGMTIAVCSSLLEVYAQLSAWGIPMRVGSIMA
jgi:hypothetical protein